MRRRTFIKRLTWTAIGICTLPGGKDFFFSTARGGEVIHVVISGDTLSHLALRYQVSIAAIKQANGLTGDLIRVGQRLRIPRTGATFLDRVRNRIDVNNFNPHRWQHIIGHHSATDNGNADIFDYAHRRHRNMANGLGYHFVIGNGTNSANGEIEVGSRWRKQIQGGHLRSTAYNRNSIGICLVGNFETKQPTANQIKSFTELVHYLKVIKMNDRCRFLVHKELEQTLCPGKYFPLQQMKRLFA